jgi:hypothetical protein
VVAGIKLALVLGVAIVTPVTLTDYVFEMHGLVAGCDRRRVRDFRLGRDGGNSRRLAEETNNIIKVLHRFSREIICGGRKSPG